MVSNRAEQVDHGHTRRAEDVDLHDALCVVEEFQTASQGLVAWEFWLEEQDLAGVWASAIGRGLIERVGTNRSGEADYALTDRGRSRLERRRRIGSAEPSRPRD